MLLPGPPFPRPLLLGQARNPGAPSPPGVTWGCLCEAILQVLPSCALEGCCRQPSGLGGAKLRTSFFRATLCCVLGCSRRSPHRKQLLPSRRRGATSWHENVRADQKETPLAPDRQSPLGAGGGVCTDHFSSPFPSSAGGLRAGHASHGTLEWSSQRSGPLGWTFSFPSVSLCSLTLYMNSPLPWQTGDGNMKGKDNPRPYLNTSHYFPGPDAAPGAKARHLSTSACCCQPCDVSTL